MNEIIFAWIVIGISALIRLIFEFIYLKKVC